MLPRAHPIERSIAWVLLSSAARTRGRLPDQGYLECKCAGKSPQLRGQAYRRHQPNTYASDVSDRPDSPLYRSHCWAQSFIGTLGYRPATSANFSITERHTATLAADGRAPPVLLVDRTS